MNIRLYRKISIMLSLIALGAEDAIAMQKNHKEEQENNSDQINILEKLPPELIEQVMDFLYVGDSGYKYLQLYRKIPMTREQAKRSISKFYERELLLSRNLGEFIDKIENHYNKLEDSFSNYTVLQKAYEKVILGKDDLLQEVEEITQEINIAIMQQNWTLVKKILKKIVKTKKSLFLDNLDSNNNFDIKIVRKQLKAIIQTCLILNKVKWSAYYTLGKIITGWSLSVAISPFIMIIPAIAQASLECMGYNNTFLSHWWPRFLGTIGIGIIINFYQDFFSSTMRPNSVPVRAKFVKILNLIETEKNKLRQRLEELENNKYRI